jgi:RNA polymerase sigma factor (sigma-70 family)
MTVANVQFVRFRSETAAHRRSGAWGVSYGRWTAGGRRLAERYSGRRLGWALPSVVTPELTMAVDDSPLTRTSLVLQLRDPANHAAWQEFARLYGPVIYGFARKRGLQDADAADLMQDVLRSVSGAIGTLDYDRKRGTFRGWLFTITRNKIFNFLAARKIRPQGSGDTTTNRLLDQEPATDDGEAAWELEYQRRLAAIAMEKIKGEFQERSWQAFWLTAVEGVGAADVSKELGMSTGAVYVATSRVLARLKEEVDALRKLEDES